MGPVLGLAARGNAAGGLHLDRLVSGLFKKNDVTGTIEIVPHSHQLEYRDDDLALIVGGVVALHVMHEIATTSYIDFRVNEYEAHVGVFPEQQKGVND